jgi:opacity protein-like surface antigen
MPAYNPCHHKKIFMKKTDYLLTALFISLSTPACAAKILPASATATPASAASPAASPGKTIIVAAEAPRPATPAAAPTASAAAAKTTPGSPAFYLGAQLGDSSIGALMGYQLSKMFAMELSYDYMDPKYTPTTIAETSRISASGLALFPLKFSEMGPMAIYVKVGYARTTDKFTVNDPGLGPGFPPTSTVTTTLKTGVIGGAGVQVDLSSNSTARLGVHVVGSERTAYMAAMYKF